MRWLLLVFFAGPVLRTACSGQYARADIHTDFVLYQKRVMLEKDLRERVTGKTFSGPLDADTEYKYELACQAVSQFQLASPGVAPGLEKLLASYDSLQYDTKKALLEAVYAVYPAGYADKIRTIADREREPKLFAMAALYLYRYDSSTLNCNRLKIGMAEKFPGYDSVVILQELAKYLSTHTAYRRSRLPSVPALFAYRGQSGQKTIYSFQRWNRDYPGLAIVQNADGKFVRENGRLQVFEQLARSGSDLPYFITNGSTPQGIYSIQGLGVAHNNFIGPTPNIQLVMPNETSWADYFQVNPKVDSLPGDNPEGGTGITDTLGGYLALMPSAWKAYAPMMEAWYAGKAGRTEIIAHGSTLDPEYFNKRPFYPLTPTQGCLCAKEIWNPTTGHLLISEQINLVNAFLSGKDAAGTRGKGYLYVINVDDKQAAVGRAEVEEWVRAYEKVSGHN